MTEIRLNRDRQLPADLPDNFDLVITDGDEHEPTDLISEVKTLLHTRGYFYYVMVHSGVTRSTAFSCKKG